MFVVVSSPVHGMINKKKIPLSFFYFLIQDDLLFQSVVSCSRFSLLLLTLNSFPVKIIPGTLLTMQSLFHPKLCKSNKVTYLKKSKIRQKNWYIIFKKMYTKGQKFSLKREKIVNRFVHLHLLIASA